MSQFFLRCWSASSVVRAQRRLNLADGDSHGFFGSSWRGVVSMSAIPDDHFVGKKHVSETGAFKKKNPIFAAAHGADFGEASDSQVDRTMEQRCSQREG